VTPVTTTARDDAWFEALFREHARSVFRYVARRAAHDDADDLTADVLAVAWRRREEVPEGHELAWLYRTAAFTVANHHRKSRPVLVEVLPEGPDRDSPELLVVADLEVRAALATLSERDREVLLLTAWEGVDGEGLAQALGISRGGADAALSRARSRLRDAFAAQDRPDAAAAPRAVPPSPAPPSPAPRKDDAAHDTDRVTGRQGGPAPRRT
jgi:RNA polymerase sigma factor (sigma-70 family)